MRTPLARLLVLLESAQLPGADRADLITRARDEVERIGELIDDVLFLSELESGRAVVALGSIRALPVIERVVAETGDRAHATGLELKVECTASFELPLRARMLQVVVENLVENAIRYAGTDTTCTVTCAGRGRGVAPDRVRRRRRAFPRTSCRACSNASTGPTRHARRSAPVSASRS